MKPGQTALQLATRRGWFEPAVRLGEHVAAGQLAGWYHDLERLETPEEELHFAEAGIVISRRLHTMCEAGDCLERRAIRLVHIRRS